MEHLTATQIQALISGELNGPAKTAVENHLAHCAQCARQHSEAQDFWNTLGQMGGISSDGQVRADLQEPASKNINNSVWSAVRERTLKGSRREDWFFGGRLATQATLAATALAAGLFVGGLLPGTSNLDSGQIDDGSYVEVATADELSHTDWFNGTVWAEGTTSLESTWISLGLDDDSDTSNGITQERNSQ